MKREHRAALRKSSIHLAAKTKRVDGEDLEKSAFAYRPSDELDDWKLPIKFSTEEKTKSHIRNAIARWSSTDMPDADEKSKARSRIKAAAKENGIDLEEGSLARSPGAHRARLQPCFRAALQSDGALELLVYEDIGANFWTGGGVTAKSVKEELDRAGVYSRIALRINSPGGDAFEGVAIFNLLRAQKKPIDVFIDGIAASAASIVAMAGDTITMGQSAMMMIHNAWTCCCGDGDDMRKCADTLDKVSASIGQAYSQRSGKSAEQVKAIMDAETWLSAQDCVEQGFATAIASDKDNEGAMALARSFRLLKEMKHVPAALRPKADDDGAEGDGMECGCNCEPCQDGNCDECDCVDASCVACMDGGNCLDCGTSIADSNISQYEAHLKLLLRA